MNWDKEVAPFPSNIISYSMHLPTIFDEDDIVPFFLRSLNIFLADTVLFCCTVNVQLNAQYSNIWMKCTVTMFVVVEQCRITLENKIKDNAKVKLPILQQKCTPISIFSTFFLFNGTVLNTCVIRPVSECTRIFIQI